METADGLALINQELIPSSVIDAMTPTAYSYSAAVAGERFYIDLVGVEGGSERYGPYTLSQSGGLPDGVEMTPAVWLPIVVRQ